jgi:hypothetical protein
MNAVSGIVMPRAGGMLTLPTTDMPARSRSPGLLNFT